MKHTICRQLSDAGRGSSRILSCRFVDEDDIVMKPTQDFIIIERALAVDLAEIVEELAAQPLDEPLVSALIVRARGALKL